MNNAAKTCLFSDFHIITYPFIYDIISFFQKSGASRHGVLLVEFDLQYALFKLTVMYDTDIFDADLIHGEDRGDSGNAAGFVLDVQIQNIRLVDQSGCGYINGIAVIPGTCKHLVQIIRFPVINRTADLDQHPDIFVKYGRNIPAVLHADLLPHNGRGGGDTRNIAESAGGDGLHVFRVVVQGVYQDLQEPKR